MRAVKRYEEGGKMKKEKTLYNNLDPRLSKGIVAPRRDDRLRSFDRVDRDPGPSHAQIHRDPVLREEAGMTALNMAPVIGDVMLAGRTIKNLSKGNYKEAATDVLLRKMKTGLPGPMSAAVKRGIKKEIS